MIDDGPEEREGGRGLYRPSSFCRRRSRRPNSGFDRSPRKGRWNHETAVAGSSTASGDGLASLALAELRARKEEGPAVTVSIEIMRAIPSVSRSSVDFVSNDGGSPEQSPGRRRRRSSQRRRSSNRSVVGALHAGAPASDDVFATSYASSPELFIALGIFEGEICVLSGPGDGERVDGEGAPTTVRLLPTEEDAIAEASTGTAPWTGEGTGDCEATFSLRVPPCLAASVGMRPHAPNSMRGILRPPPYRALSSRSGDAMGPNDGEGDACWPPLASCASLREIGRPVTDVMPQLPLLSLDDESGGGEEEEDGDDNGKVVKALRSYFSPGDGNEGSSGKESGRGRLVCLGSIICVHDHPPPDSGGALSGELDDPRWGASADWSVRFYEVASLESSESNGLGNCGDERKVGGCCRISKETKLALLPCEVQSEAKTTIARRLPPPSSAASFARSVLAAAVRSTDDPLHWKKSCRDSVTGEGIGCDGGRHWGMTSHPSVDALVDAMLVQPLHSGNGGAGGNGMNRIIHAIGNEWNHVQACIEAASDVVGMRCLHVDGLSAFFYRCHASKTAAATGEGRTPASTLEADAVAPPITGSIVNKLSGLQSALDMAWQCRPCVLHVCNFDEELTDSKNDAEARRDEEGRFLSCLGGALSSLGATTGDREDRRTFYTLRGAAPSVIVVLSTSDRLDGDGLIASALPRDSVRISAPDESYGRELWDNACGGENTFDEVKRHLLGLSAEEMLFVRRRFVRRMALAESGMGTELPGEAGGLYTPTCKAQDTETIVLSMLQEMEGSPLAVGSGSASKLSSSLIPDVRWADVGGLSHVRTEIMDAIELPLRRPDLFSGGGQGRSGILLFGPPGTGKTLVAKAVATECSLPFLSVKGPELLGSYVGESESNVRGAFASARSAASASAGKEGGGAAVLFFDELDSLAPRRGGLGDGGGVMERVVATLLGELDGGSGDDGKDDSVRHVFVMGATNRPDLLDPALLRPGRFDRLVYLGIAQNDEDRVKILAAQTRKFKFQAGRSAESVAKEVIKSIPSSLSGADFSSVASGALLRALGRLCKRADAEADALRCERNGNSRTNNEDPYLDATGVEDVLRGWDNDELEPIVTAEDLIEAARDVIPSVTAQDLEKYEELKMQFG